ncbi:unnamed protein product [Ilex paraguariensis]|uniref:Uncharacterized protein n=1 Tax=Ilex paraguariensis TaxID=185542 RepID=A0ABC8V449_9AQUA
MVEAAIKVAAKNDGMPQVPNLAPIVETAVPTPSPRDNTVLFSTNVALAPASADVLPTPQGDASTVHTDIVPSSCSAESFFVNIDELFCDIGVYHSSVQGSKT